MKKKHEMRVNKQIKTVLNRVGIVLSLSFILSACGGGGGGSEAKKETTVPVEETATCAGSALGTDNECITISNRDSILYQPKDTTSDGIAIFLHGAPGNANKVMNIFDAKMIADNYNLLVLSPEGINSQTWGWLSFNKEETDNIDINYINELLIKVKGDYNVTSDKLYVFGYSAGGFMAYKLACQIPEQITAVISLAGQYRGSLEACSTATPVNLHHFHSPTDIAVPYNGRQVGSIQSVDETISYWQKKNGCDQTFTTLEQAGVTSTSVKTITENYSNCSNSLALSKMSFVAHEASYLADKLLAIYGYLFIDD